MRVPGRHAYYLPKNSRHWEILYLTMKGCEVERLADFITERYGNVLDFPVESPTVRMAWLRTIAPDEKTPNLFELSRFTYQFMLTLLEELMKGVPKKEETDLLARVNDYLIAHQGETSLSVNALARAMNTSRTHFSRVFREASGIPPQQYILETRLDLAAQLLKAENPLVKDVATRCGFRDTNYFCRAFRKKYGLSPLQYHEETMEKR